MLMVHLNLSEDIGSEWDTKSDNFLIAKFNTFPSDITAENILKRKYRPWLLQITEQVNAQAIRTYDVLDIVIRLQQLRKEGKLRNKSPAVSKPTEKHDVVTPTTPEVLVRSDESA